MRLTSYDISASLLTHNCSNSPNSNVESPSLFERLGSGCNPLCNASMRWHCIIKLQNIILLMFNELCK